MAPPSRRRSRAFFCLFLAVALLPTSTVAKTRTLKIVNSCKEKLWMAYYTSVGPAPSHVTGWEAPSGTSEDLIVEESWGGRVWARTGCDFTSDLPDYEQCETGGCVGGLECGKGDEGGTGRLPVTLAEFNLQTETDHYDSSNGSRTPSLIQPSEAVLPSPRLMPLFLSQVDGFNVPMAITNSADCPLSNCPFDLRLNCPPELQKKGADGSVVGCMTDCGATEKPEYCCAGAYDKPETCPSANIPNYRWWKDNCPIAYAFAYDEASGTALFTCSKQVDYTITFCPSDDLYDDTATLPDGSVVSQGTGKPAETVPITGSNAAAGGNGAGTPQTTMGEAAAPMGEGAATTTAAETKPSGEGAGTATSGSKTTAAGTGGGAATTAKSTTPAATGSTPSSTSAANSSDSSSSDGDTILGMSKTVAIAVAAALVVLIIAGIGVALYMSHKGHGGRGKHHRAPSSDESSDDDERSSATDSSGSSDGGGKR
ncbi:thaumatin [Leucosporidium creatinivorum]|uniref:Thaumatin n=1 Tax=Leucosporidium creatinivorum TaxID=106004 RepID=A0A1Y2G1I5_9BASI|nr:thaumatin [Leucosporidium creatinivorum]